FGGHGIDEFLVDRTLDEDAAAGRTHLPLVDEHAEERAVDGRLEVGVGEKDVRRLAAELQRYFLQRSCSAAHDRLSDVDAAGERNLVDVRMLDYRGAGALADSRDDVHDTGRQAR